MQESCNCKPSYYGVAWDRSRNRNVKTRRLPTVDAARNARIDLIKQLEHGEAPVGELLRLTEARVRFVQAARNGRALNERGQRYKPSAIANVDECLRVHVEPTLGTKRLSMSAEDKCRLSSTSSRQGSPAAACAR
jgi:hypothetical protein